MVVAQLPYSDSLIEAVHCSEICMGWLSRSRLCIGLELVGLSA